MGVNTVQKQKLSVLGLSVRGGGDFAITGLCVDSRETRPGYLFAGLPGVNAHGATFAKYAVRMGATAILTDPDGYEHLVADDEIDVSTLAIVIDDNPRRVLARISAKWFEIQPETMVAITGTNGKTSVSTFTRQIWQELGYRAVNFGTTGVEGAIEAGLSHTTPEPVTLHRLLADLAAQGVTHASMEASSHGLAQHRLDGVALRAAGFTNFSQDHLDYHADFAEYFDAKMALFNRVLPTGGATVINLDDPKSDDVVAIAAARGQKVTGVGTHKSADLRILANRFDGTGQDLRFSWNGEDVTVRLNLIGGFQAANVLMAAALAAACGGDPSAITAALPHLTTVRGRMELAARRENGASVFVDYAHTPDALETALAALRPHVIGRLIVVFGAGGDRDQGKRPLMGAAARDNADVVIVTDDNPRSEDPATIRAAILAAVPQATESDDRATAILTGVDGLSPGDCLLIAGKGHETGQVVGDDIFPFNDVEQASIAVAALDGAAS